MDSTPRRRVSRGWTARFCYLAARLVAAVALTTAAAGCDVAAEQADVCTGSGCGAEQQSPIPETHNPPPEDTCTGSDCGAEEQSPIPDTHNPPPEDTCTGSGCGADTRPPADSVYTETPYWPDLCGNDPDCGGTDECGIDWYCNPQCGFDPDCQPWCGADNDCDPRCDDDPDCGGSGCGFAPPACVEGPMDGNCDWSCMYDPDCKGLSDAEMLALGFDGGSTNGKCSWTAGICEPAYKCTQTGLSAYDMFTYNGVTVIRPCPNDPECTSGYFPCGADGMCDQWCPCDLDPDCMNGIPGSDCCPTIPCEESCDADNDCNWNCEDDPDCDIASCDADNDCNGNCDYDPDCYAACDCDYTTNICDAAARCSSAACDCDPDCGVACDSDSHCDSWCPTDEDEDCIGSPNNGKYCGDVSWPCPAGQVAVRFACDTNTSADGSHPLAAVLPGENVYITGSGATFGHWGELNDWNPQMPEFAMDDNDDGTFAITLCADPGATLEYKYLKSTADPYDDAWGNGMKDFKTKAEDPCIHALNELDQGTYDAMAGGLWEVANLQWTVPTGVTEAYAPVVQIEAWRNYAWETFGYYHSCD